MIHTPRISQVFYPPHDLSLLILSNLGETAFKRCPYKSILLLKPIVEISGNPFYAHRLISIK